MPNTGPETIQTGIHVAVGVLVNKAGEVLLALRHQHQHQGGLWEFPGGKVEPEETVMEALVREFREEVRLEVAAADPLLTVSHDYGDKRVLLDVWRIHEWQGEAHGSEGQILQWVPVAALVDYDFPAANESIVRHLLRETELPLDR